MSISGSSPRARDHGFHPLRVGRITTETSDAVSLTLEVPAELTEAFAYRAGQFVTFKLEIDGQQQLRSYSMSSSPEVDDEFRVTVKQVPQGVVSTWLTRQLREGDVLATTCPAGVFTLGTGTSDLIAFAGGSGITPVYSVIKSALATTSRRVRLLYANRDDDATIFRTELDALCEKYGDRLEVVHHHDCAGGFLTEDRIAPYADASNSGAAGSTPADFYICGPTPFMDLVESTLLARDVTREQVHIERFSPALEPAALDPERAAEDSAEAAQDAGKSDATQVTIELDGKTATGTHRPGTTILQTARSMGLTPPYSCEAGDCATCMAKLVEGGADMFVNNALYEDEVAGGWVLTCQAVPNTPTVHVVYGYEE